MLYAIVALVVIIIDQWVKYWVAGSIPLESLGETFIPGVVSLVNLHNDGAAFGFLSGGGARIYFIILTGVFTVAVILALATKFISGPVSRWSIVLITAGGLSNCLDRVISGYVQDMFKFELSFLDWFPIFNVADIVITVFCVVFILALFLERTPSGDEEFAEDDEEEDRPSRRRSKAKAEPMPEEEVPAEKPKKHRRHEDEYEQYKAARAARQRAEAAAASAAAPAAPVSALAPDAKPVQSVPADNDPFAEWERANARAGVQPSYAPPAAPVVKPAAPAEAPAPAPAAKPVKSVDDFSLDDILNEFKD